MGSRLESYILEETKKEKKKKKRKIIITILLFDIKSRIKIEIIARIYLI